MTDYGELQDRLIDLIVMMQGLESAPIETVQQCTRELESLSQDMPAEWQNVSTAFTEIITVLTNTAIDEINPETTALILAVLNGAERFCLGEPEGEPIMAEAAAALSQLAGQQKSGLNDLALQLIRLRPDDKKAAQALAAQCKETAAANQEKEWSASLKKTGTAISRNYKKGGTALESVLQDLNDLLEQAMLSEDDTGDTPVAVSDHHPVQSEDGSPLPPDVDQAILEQFLLESAELLEQAEGALLELENNPDDSGALNNVFRTFHTVKGASAYLGIPYIPDIAHSAETMMSLVRDNSQPFNSTMADLALRSVDMLKVLLSDVKAAAVDGSLISMPEQYQQLITQLDNPSSVPQTDPAIAMLKQEAEVVLEENAPESSPDNAASTQRRSAVRVDMQRLDQLVDMVGELVVAHSIAAQDSDLINSDHYLLQQKIDHLGKILRELQDLSLSLRMIPLHSTFQQMARLVRDLVRRCGKEIQFRTAGGETEIDRNMVDIVREPLMHLIRNSVDHGIESAEARIDADKPPAGTITLSAEKTGGSILIMVEDDGKGLDPAAIRAKAESVGLVSPQDNLSERDVFDLIFQPGFSTAEEVTEVSGRGVGMDVVRSTIEQLHGAVELTSQPGRGTTFTIRLPLTLAITEGMLVRVSEERFIIPTSSIDRCVHPHEAESVAVTGSGELIKVRDQLLPVIRLRQYFNIQEEQAPNEEGLYVLIRDKDFTFAVLVDELMGQQRVVAKPLGMETRHVAGVLGGAILGDGRVSLILDLSELRVLVQHQNVHESNTK